MAEEKVKTESYEMTGGMNTKASPFVNAPNEFRNIVNMNFANPGALTKRPGSSDYVAVSGFIGGTSVNKILGGYQFNSIEQGYYSIVAADANKIFVLDSNVNGASFTGGCSNLIAQGISTPPDSVLSFITFADRLFYANGNQFKKNQAFGGMGATNIGAPTGVINGPGNFDVGLPKMVDVVSPAGTTAYSVPVNITFIPASYVISPLPGTPYWGFSGYVSMSVGWENTRGYAGPESAVFAASFLLSTISIPLVSGVSNLSYYQGSTLPSTYDGRNLAFYASLPDGGVRFKIASIKYEKILGTTGGLSEYYGGYYVLNGVGYGGLAYGVPANSNLDMSGSKPRYLELYNNQLFAAGFKGAITTYSDAPISYYNVQYNNPVVETISKSAVHWSDIGEPEAFDPANFIEFRTNDGDRITGLKSYAGSLVVTKERSFHRITGTDPTNFLVQEISDQYGCLSNEAMVTWENKLWFLDQKGICEYNGANITIISNKVQPIFDAMNISAAREFATGTHYKQQNEVWFAIPTNGAIYNNTIVVFDYLSNVWSVYEGLNPSCLFLADGTLSYKRPFLGGSTGKIRYMDPSNYSDAGAGISCLVETRFLAATGQTVERQYRRFYLNVDPVGSTQAVNIDFRTNFGTSLALNRTMYQSPFQSRIDFGLSAKAIQAAIGHYSASLPFKINGFTFESRYQRNV